MATIEQCANPLLLGFLKEWWDVARERSNKSATTYKKAYESMKACPLTFSHPSEAQQLHGLGPKLCERLTDELTKHCAANGLPLPKKSRKRKSLGGLEGLGENAEPAPAPKKTRKPKPYVPALRSGPYAIILALATLKEDSDERLTKGQIILLAQDHCDSSFTAPSEARGFYTAWSSMKTLEDKDLVHTRGRPARRYALTEEGWDVAHRIQNTTGGRTAVLDSRPPQETAPEAPAPKTKAKAPASKHPTFTGFGDFLDIEDDPDSKETQAEESNTVSRKDSRTPHWSIGTGEAGQRLGGAPVDKFGTFAPAKERQRPPAHNYFEISSSPEPQSAGTSLPALPACGKTSNAKPLSNSTDRPSEPLQNGASRTTETSFPSFQPIIIQPGTFIVQLVLDTREVRSKDDRDYIEKELIKKGIKPEVKPLELGDFFWVAKCNDPTLLSRYGEEGDSIALDYIVERKRLDDLVGSVKDGRFSEQKFRLRRSGVKNVVYLIEDVTLSSETATKYHDMMESAIASTQVVDGYFVKRTAKLDDTIRYIARMTAMLKGLYESKPLRLIPTTHLDAATYNPFITHLRATHPHPYHITYTSFALMASKSDSLTLRDVYLKMLMCIRGVSGEKAIEIQKIWTTPRALLEAYEACGDQRGRDCLVEGRLGRHPVGRRKVGKALSMKIAGIWGVGEEGV